MNKISVFKYIQFFQVITYLFIQPNSLQRENIYKNINTEPTFSYSILFYLKKMNYLLNTYIISFTFSKQMYDFDIRISLLLRYE